MLSYQYSWFCERYRAWQGRLDVVMRQDHRAGEKLFVDYAGQTVPVVDRLTGEVREAQIFVAVLGVTNYTYAEATGPILRSHRLAERMLIKCVHTGHHRWIFNIYAYAYGIVQFIVQ